MHSCFNKVDGVYHGQYVAKVMDLKHVQNPCMRVRKESAQNNEQKHIHTSFFLQPVKCADCNHTIQTFGLFKRHKNALSKYKTQAKRGDKIFPSICEMLAHSS